MVTILREGGLQFVIFVDDHEPAHVHVYGDGELKVEIATDDGLPRLVWAVGMKAGDRLKAMDAIRENRDLFLARWHEIHGDRR
jgi:Domain of unknown function (DUF4160)